MTFFIGALIQLLRVGEMSSILTAKSTAHNALWHDTSGSPILREWLDDVYGVIHPLTPATGPQVATLWGPPFEV
jgi:hypothetical protein